MFMEPADYKQHGLPHNPFKALIVPRPIGWITTMDSDGLVNLAPYSFFNGVADTPPMVYFSSVERSRERGLKDSQRNAEETGEFVVNLATWDLREAMNESSAPLPPGESEVPRTGLAMAPSIKVKPPRVARSPAHLECRYVKTVDLPTSDPENGNYMVIGEVVGLHIDESVLTGEGLVDVSRIRPIARLGYMDYAVVNSVFAMQRPTR